MAERSLRGPVPVRLTVPAGWATVAQGRATIAFVDGGSPGDVPTSLVVLTGEVGGDSTLDDVAAAASDGVASVAGPAAAGPAVTRRSTQVRRVAGRTAIQTVLVVPVPARGVTLVQVQTVIGWPSLVDGNLNVVQLQLTCRDDQWPIQRPVLDAVLDSMVVA